MYSWSFVVVVVGRCSEFQYMLGIYVCAEL
jgi:hypothetical protein